MWVEVVRDAVLFVGPAGSNELAHLGEGGLIGYGEANTAAEVGRCILSRDGRHMGFDVVDDVGHGGGVGAVIAGSSGQSICNYEAWTRHVDSCHTPSTAFSAGTVPSKGKG